jgi:hypothetical protein
MRRLTALGLSLLPILGVGPDAHAAGGAGCVISGTINLEPATPTKPQGTWRIEQGVIDCRGLFNAGRRERILGPGTFTGSGTFQGFVGSGTVDYQIPTSEQDVHIHEAHTLVLAGGGAFTTPSLRGSFQIAPPGNGDSLFLAQAMLVRFRPPDH